MDDISQCLTATNDITLFAPVAYESHDQDSRYNDMGEVCETISAKYGTGGGNQPIICETYVMTTTSHPSIGRNIAPTLDAVGYKDPPVVIKSEDGSTSETYSFFPQRKAESVGLTRDVSGTLINAAAPGYSNGVITPDYIARRLTELEAERLQGYPDYWTHIGEWKDSKGKAHKPSAAVKYKALGNSLCLPQWWYLVSKMRRYQTEEHPTLASLFDGIGGFPLVWERCYGEGTALWASEIEEFPIAVTKRHFPNMQHLGDITKLNGANIPKVSCITSGSPCQNLSIAGNRKGFNGDESGLFIEGIRIIKEMRADDIRNGRTDVDIRPRWAIWENVRGALSSNGGADFHTALEEFAHIVDPTAAIPRPQGKWEHAGYIRGNGWSIAWRLMDGQHCGRAITDSSGCLVYGGTPQRRHRIALVADFASEHACEVLFDGESLPRDYPQGIEPWQAAPRDIGAGSTADD